MTVVREGDLLWQPGEDFKHRCGMTQYLRWLEREKGLRFDDFQAAWKWSVDSIGDFWSSMWDYFAVGPPGSYETALSDARMPGACWFPGATLNYAERVFAASSEKTPALLFRSEHESLESISWQTLRAEVASVAAALRAMGVERGDRVVAYLPNIPETVVAFLACASVGAIWSSCSPDFGAGSVVDRFLQIEPKVLFAIDGYQYNGKRIDRGSVVEALQAQLTSLRHTVLVPYLDREAAAGNLRNATTWDAISSGSADLTFEPVPFDHPLWVLYSSGTTGLPKPIVQGHGGIVLEHLKSLALHMDIGPDDRFFWFTTTGWMMWNLLVGGLLAGATVLLYDGSPAYPDMDVLWDFAAQTGMTSFGMSAGYIGSCMKSGLEPARAHDLGKLVCLGSTGSPLPPEGFAWVYENVKRDIWLASVSGGTDVCTAFVGGCPLLPVRAGEIQCRCLGAGVEAFDESGEAVIDQVGELVIAKPMPSMPLYFWNDPGNRRYLESYFEMYPGLWRHGDWIKITSEGGVIIYGRSDATINRMGIRMGSSEFYSAVEELPQVLDSLVVGLERPNGEYFMPLFVVLRPGVELNDSLTTAIRHHIRQRLTPRHVPDGVYAISAVPRTLNGKKLEVPVKKVLMGVPVEKAANPDGMSNPESLQFFVDFARRIEVP